METMNKLIKKLAGQFGKFLGVGLIWTLLSMFFMWMLIDIMGIPGWLGSSAVVALVFFGRFYTYILIGLMKHEFMKYASANIVFSLATVAGMWFFVDFLGMPAKYASVLVVGGLFVIKFGVFKKMNLIG